MLPLPHNLEPRYDTIIGLSGAGNTYVDRLIGYIETTQVRMIPHIHLKF